MPQVTFVELEGCIVNVFELLPPGGRVQRDMIVSS
jgi:hypothetical protein